jgi:RHS repeat-associated protein
MKHNVFSLGTLVTLICFLPAWAFAQPTGANMNNPIVMGTYGIGTYNYSDTRNNVTSNGYGNDYGQPSHDIFYRFTVQGETQITISHCASNFDTYVHLLTSNGDWIASNDDNGPSCSPSARASLNTTIQSGTYYIVSEGWNTASGNINTSVTLTVQPPMTSKNFIRTWKASAPETDANSLIAKGINEVKQSTQYFDGLGRPEQTVIKKASLSSFGNLDIVTPSKYDSYGREIQKYLPYVSHSSEGQYKISPFPEQQTFYTGSSSPLIGQNENTFYAKTDYESSPLNRVLKEMAPGANWAGVNKGVSMEYLVNTAEEEVRVWNVTNLSGSFGSYTSSTVYPAGELYKNTTTDEHGKKVVVYKDKQGNVVLKKVQIADIPGANHSGWLCTYYIYDDLGQLRAVIQPKAVEAMNGTSNWTLNAQMLNELTFRYEYDGKGRMIMKKVSGAEPVYMVYDARDRLVMSQDGNQRTLGKWMAIAFDGLNRPVQTGLLTISGTHAAHLSAANNSTSYPSTSSGFELLTQTGYDDYSQIPSASGLDSIFYPWHNDYFITSYNTAPYYAQPVQKTTATKGLVTWTATKVLGNSQYLYTVLFYDEKGRQLQVKSKNVTGGVDITTTQYNFSGQPIQTAITHNTSSQGYVVRTHFYYDGLGRLTYSDKNINEQGWTPVVSMEYDALGNLKNKKLAPGYNGWTGLETLTYDYNIRGWMLGVNRPELSANNGSAKKFAFELGYDKQTNTSGRNYTAPQYNGNITGMVWESAGDGVRRKYDYSYDNASRLMQGLFEQDNAGGSWGKDQINFDLKMGDGTTVSTAYDANGNIKKMQQWGLKGLTSAQIDNLTYSYQVNGSGTDLTNKLYRVTDGNNDAGTKLGDFKDGIVNGDDYSYDVNGNLSLDNNKVISSITYNYLNLPQTITITGKGTIEYVYDAAGNKLKKITTDNTVNPAKITTTLYLFGTYENDVLQFLPMEEGRLRPIRNTSNQITGFAYDYFLKDHLGNVRMVLTDEQKTDAYPAATMETASASTEQALYSKVAETRVDKPSGYPYDSYLDPHYKVAKVRGDGQKIGPGIVLKVMAGDKINLRVSSYWNSGVSPDPNPANPLNDLIAVLSGSIAPLAAGKASSSDLSGSSVFSNQAQSFLNSRSYISTKPKAYVQWVFFDEQFKYVNTSSGFEQVGNSGSLTPHIRSNLPVDKNGYVYVYVSNETTNLDVFFDNLQVTHIHGPILEETHYYPFGLAMAGISSKAAQTSDCGCPNKKGFNGNEIQNKEFSDGSGLEVYDFNARTFDPQIGRFIQIDPLLEVGQESLTPYQFGYNDPVRYNDPDGKCPMCLVWAIGEAIVESFLVYKAADATSDIIKQNRNSSSGGSNSGLDSKTQKAIDGIIRNIERKNQQTDIYKPKDVVKSESTNPSDKLKQEVKSLEKSEKSLEKNVQEHKEKLENYKQDPDKYDNKGLLKDVSPERREQIINGRIKSLESQINKNQNELNKVRQQLEQKNKQLNQSGG